MPIFAKNNNAIDRKERPSKYVKTITTLVLIMVILVNILR